MTIRFLMTTASQAPDYPFQAGQELHLSCLTPQIRQWLTEGRAEVLRHDEPEQATVTPAERAVTTRKGRKRVSA